MQDAVASEAYTMLLEARELSGSLQHARAASQAAQPAATCALLGAINVADYPGNPQAVLAQLQEGWWPVLPQAAVPSIADVPWLQELEGIVAAMGFAVQHDESTGAFTIAQVRAGVESCCLSQQHVPWQSLASVLHSADCCTVTPSRACSQAPFFLISF